MKKLLSLIIIPALIFISIAPTYGAQSDSKELEAAILSVKNLVTIGDSYTNFTYSSWQGEAGTAESGKKMWSLNWSEPQYAKSVYAVVDSNGLIRNYNRYEDGVYSQSFGTLSKKDGEGIALSFLKKVLPKEYNDIRFNQYYGYGNLKSYTFNLYINDVKVDFIHMTVGVNSESHEVVDYSSDNLGYLDKTSFPASDKIITLKEGKAAYLKDIGVKLGYRIYNDYDKQTTKTFLSYGLASQNWGIDALTGKPLDYNYYNMYEGGEGGMGGQGGSRDSDSLSPIEENAVTDIEGLLSQKEGEGLLKSKVQILSNAGKLDYVSLSKDMFTQQYVWYFSYEKGAGSIDAMTGEVISFSLYTDNEKKTNNISLDKAKDTAKKMIDTLSPEKGKNVVFDEFVSSYGDDFDAYYLTFTRLENDLPIVDNTINVTVAKDDGKVISYYTNWNDNVKFPKPGDVITEEKAFDIFAEKSGFDLAYIVVGERPLLAYIFSDIVSYQIDPDTGGLLDYDGKPFRDIKVDGYTDIKGKWYENVVTTLLENGYYLEGDSFNGNKAITQEDFFRYLYSKDSYYMDREELYLMIKQNGVIEPDEINPEGLLLRQDAAKFAVRYLGLEKAGKNYKIYINVFKDYVKPEYRGYTALAQSLGIIEGNSSKRFLPTKASSRAEAAVMIFRIINES